MWLHEIQLFSKWYILIATFIFGLIASVINDSQFLGTRLHKYFDYFVIGICGIFSLVFCFVLLIVDVDHPVEMIIFYLFISIALAYPLCGIGLALTRWMLKIKPNPGYICSQLKDALKGDNEDLILPLLKRIYPKSGFQDYDVVLDALSDKRPAVRFAAAEAAMALGMDEKISACIQGNKGDFERLGRIGDTRFFEPLMRLARGKDGRKLPALQGLMALVETGTISEESIQTLVSHIKAGPAKIKIKILPRLLQLKEGRHIVFAALLGDKNPKIRKRVANTFFAELKKGKVKLEGDWQASGLEFVKHNSSLLAEALCDRSPKVRKKASILCGVLSIKTSAHQAIEGNDEDFDRLGQSAEGWILARLAVNARHPSVEHSLSAIEGMAAMVKSGTLPETFLFFLEKLLKKESSKKHPAWPKPGNDNQKMRPISDDVLKMIRTLINRCLLEGYCHENGKIRKSMAGVAAVMKMDDRIWKAIEGDDSDFQRMGEIGDARILKPLLHLAFTKNNVALPAARGVVALCNSDAFSGNPRAQLRELIIKGSSEVGNLAADALVDMGKKGAPVLLDLLRDQRKQIRVTAAKALLGCAKKASRSLGDTWSTIRDLVTASHSDIAGMHQDGYHCDYDRGCAMVGVDPHSDMMVENGTFYRAHRVNQRTPHSDNLGIGLSLDED